MSLDQTVSELRDEISQLRKMMFIAATALLVGLLLSNLSMWSPGSQLNPVRAERVFVDMLGSRDNLPVLTKMVFAYSSAAGGWLPIAMIISFTAAAWSLMSLNKRNTRFIWIAIIAALFLCAHWAIVSVAVNLPLMAIIEGINEK
jgi:hypothetical protein